MSKTAFLRIQQLRNRRNRLSKRWHQAMSKNNGEARELRRQIAVIDQEIDALEGK